MRMNNYKQNKSSSDCTAGQMIWNSVDKTFFPFQSGEPMYDISLWDYSLPSFCSGSSYYFGTMRDIENFIENLRRIDAKRFIDTIAAFEKFKEGQKGVTHNVAYKEISILTAVTSVLETNMQLKRKPWEYINPYGFSYYLKCDAGIINQAIVRMEDGRVFRILRATFQNLCYTIDTKKPRKYQSIDMVWGHPGIVEFERNDDGIKLLRYALYVEEHEYKTEKEACVDFGNLQKANLAVFGNDIFGDG